MVQQLYAIRQMEPWRAKGLSLGLNVILWASKLPFSMKVRVLIADICTKCVIRIVRLLTAVRIFKRN
jgi:hypothetical protein